MKTNKVFTFILAFYKSVKTKNWFYFYILTTTAEYLMDKWPVDLIGKSQNNTIL